MNDDQLKASLQELYERAPCGYIFTLPDGTFTRVNQTLLDWTGYGREDLVAKRRFQDLLTVPGKIFYENQYAPLLRLQGFVHEVAFDLVCADREPLPVLINSVEQRGADGPPVLVASTIFNATDRRRYEQELLRARQQAEQLAAVVTAAGDAIVTITPDGVVQTWNAAATQLFGYPAADMVGRTMADVLPLLHNATDDRLTNDLRAGRPVFLEVTGQHADGRDIDVSVGLAPHLGLLGELNGVSAIIRDIRERRALERLQQEFLAMASHELRSPIGIIKGYAQLLRRQGRYLEPAVDAIVAQTDQLGGLVEDLLLAAQLAADRLTLQLVAVDVAALVQTIAEHQRVHRAAIRVETPSTPVVVSADRQRLGQVVTNLLTNAIKYSPADSALVVRVAQAGDVVRIAVTDEGVGIPAEALPHLFDRFYRVAGTRQTAGLGLGLYITRRIVESHGGRIDVMSQLGHGSTFTVTLSVSVEPTAEG